MEFTRAVRDGTMTDEIWRRALRRVGSERGVVEYVAWVLLIMFHQYFSWAVGVPSMRPRTGIRCFRTIARDGAVSMSAAREERGSTGSWSRNSG